MSLTNQFAIKAKDFFIEKFKAEPNIYFSPGRINLIGEHVDYNDGFVLPAAIDKGIYYAVAANNTDTINFYAYDFDESFAVNITAVKKETGWKNYVLSVVNEFLLLDKLKLKGFDCVFGGDIPQGSGISSSAAVEGGLAFAINHIFDYQLSRENLALLCQLAEHNYPNVKCGIMDQFANMMGKKDNVVLLDCQTLSYEYFPLKLDGYKIILLNSKVHHSLAAGEYNIRRKQCEEGLMIMQADSAIRSFRDVGKWENLLAYKDKMGDEVYMRCLYVVQEIERTKNATQNLQDNDIVAFGKQMFQTHEGLSKLYNVSCDELDFLVVQAKSDDTVIGSRLMGGGFGGCTINIVKEAFANAFVQKASAAYQKQFNILPEAYFVHTQHGVHQLLN
jgi:galactokinase